MLNLEIKEIAVGKALYLHIEALPSFPPLNSFESSFSSSLLAQLFFNEDQFMVKHNLYTHFKVGKT